MVPCANGLETVRSNSTKRIVTALKSDRTNRRLDSTVAEVPSSLRRIGMIRVAVKIRRMIPCSDRAKLIV